MRGLIYEKTADPRRALADFEAALAVKANLDDARAGRERVKAVLAAQARPAYSCAGSRRIALVVGNSAYANADRLSNAVNDADDIARMLHEKLCFDVTLAKDLTRDDFPARVDAFAATAQGAELALFYFAGHGLQHEGRNFLLPIDPSLSGPLALESSTVMIVAALNGKARYTLMLLDACRNNPFQEQLARAITPAPRRGPAPVECGLVPMKALPDSEMSPSLRRRRTNPRSTPRETDVTAPLAQAVLEKFAAPDTDIQLALSDVRLRVDELTQGGQIPAISGDLRHRLTLLPAR